MHPVTSFHPPSETSLPGAFTVDVLVDDAVRVRLRARGELDLATAPVLASVLNDQQRRYVHLDMSEVRFCDSAGLTALVEAHRDLLSRQGSLTLVGAGPRIQRLLRITGLDAVLFTAAESQAMPESVRTTQSRPTNLRARLARPAVRIRRPA
jgi:anti-sigma B factor antagonist